MTPASVRRRVDEPEPRYLVKRMTSGKHWATVVKHLGETVRITSSLLATDDMSALPNVDPARPAIEYHPSRRDLIVMVPIE